MRYFDAHCHIQFDAYDADRDALAKRMEERGVGGIVVGVDLESSEKAIVYVEGRENLYASVGLHPNRTEEPFDIETYKKLANHPKVVAIGECGLDYYRPHDPENIREAQIALFKKHIELAVEVDKPLIIHGRPRKGTMDAYADLIQILTEAKEAHGDRVRADIHFFVGGKEEAEAFVRLGCTLSFTAVITFAREYDEVLRSLPLAHILAETDAPYVAPLSRRGQRNDPLAAEDVADAIAHIRGEDPEMVRAALLENSCRIFQIPLSG